jgi:hypothetical protein
MAAASEGSNVRAKIRDLIYGRQPRLEAFFSCDPIRLGLLLSNGSRLLLMVPALVVNIALIKHSQTPFWPWFGFWQRWNRSLMYVIILSKTGLFRTPWCGASSMSSML